MTADELRRLFPNASQACLEANGVRLHPAQSEPTSRPALERAPRRETQGVAISVESLARYRVEFHIFSRRPLDWDNWRTKDLQDCLVAAGILPGDDWRVLEGGITSHQVHRKEEERTEIEVYEFPKEVQ